MTFSTKIQIGFLASAVALAFAAPSAFANGDRTMRNILTDPGSTTGAPAAIRAEQVKKKSSGVARDSGTTVDGIHTEAGGTPDAPGLTHTVPGMKKKSSGVATGSGMTVDGIHTDAGGTPDAPGLTHTVPGTKK